MAGSRPGWERIVATAWWDWPREFLEQHLDELCDLELFLEKYAPR